MNLQDLPFDPQLVRTINENHQALIWEAHDGQIEDMEEFNSYANKMAAAHTVVTLLAITNSKENE